MLKLFTSLKTAELLTNDPLRKTFLFAGLGFKWNIGDNMQLRGAVHSHQNKLEESVVCPIVNTFVLSQREDLKRLINLFDTEHWMFFDNTPGNNFREQASLLELVQFNPKRINGRTAFHVYGGGSMNRYWGSGMVGLIELFLKNIPVDDYLISGQQVDPHFAEAFAFHLLKFNPVLVGCRDRLGVKALSDHGISADYSGDDTIEEFLSLKQQAFATKALAGKRETFGLNLNLAQYVLPQFSESSASRKFVETELDKLFRVLYEKLGPHSTPLVVGSYLDSRLHWRDSWATIKRTLFTQYFPIFNGLDIAGAFIQGKLLDTIPILQSRPLYFTMSYHLTLLLHVLEVPTFLLAFNEYYSQKQFGLGQSGISTNDFLLSDPNELLEQQNESLADHIAARCSWNQKFNDHLDYSSGDDIEGSGHTLVEVSETRSKTRDDPSFSFIPVRIQETKSSDDIADWKRLINFLPKKLISELSKLLRNMQLIARRVISPRANNEEND